jgi:hypothetical protein
MGLKMTNFLCFLIKNKTTEKNPQFCKKTEKYQIFVEKTQKNNRKYLILRIFIGKKIKLLKFINFAFLKILYLDNKTQI